ncbi:hypothetical protein IscW_ISCW007622 [Ixodes scapularis]|uniref:G patch domain-containing protein 2-like n=1 Tax=Ixodes scapularis TaxID=6945 RepID=B7PRH0_IXOSC|nr:hypothetical protein IscW_ISCW007622 [Ixodes scapularis]|eukprot:XP_002399651.1 hypothetical protein IscW_ISCW007622 [Ixodes scapularis]
MDSALIQGIRRLLSDYDNMDELVQDLTAALEESSLPKRGATAKWSAISGDDSESSLEGGRTRDGRPRAERGQAQLSDSDELLQRLCAWRHRQSNVAAAESDSVNENFLPRPQRRKRKLKRMAVDPPSIPQRKRSVRERSLESLARVHRRSECCDSMDTGDAGAAGKPHGECSSSLSSSESDAGILTNDEGREATLSGAKPNFPGVKRPFIPGQRALAVSLPSEHRLAGRLAE